MICFFSLIHCGRSSVMFVSWIAMILITKTAFLSLFTSDDAKKKTKRKDFSTSCLVSLSAFRWHSQKLAWTTWKHGSILLCMGQWFRLVVLVWHILDSLVPTEHFIKHHSLPEYYFPPCRSLYGHSVSIFTLCHEAQIIIRSEHDSEFLCTRMASAVNTSQSNRKALGCGT